MPVPSDQATLRVLLIADDIGRLRRRCTSEVDAWTLDRISGHLETILNMLEPTAHELAHTTAPGDEDALREALRIVDARTLNLRHRTRVNTPTPAPTLEAAA